MGGQVCSNDRICGVEKLLLKSIDLRCVLEKEDGSVGFFGSGVGCGVRCDALNEYLLFFYLCVVCLVGFNVLMVNL